MVVTDGKGTVVCKNDEEAAWWNAAEDTKQELKALKYRIKQAEKDLKLTSKQVFEKFQKGAKKSIKQMELMVKIKKEFLGFCEEHLDK